MCSTWSVDTMATTASASWLHPSPPLASSTRPYIGSTGSRASCSPAGRERGGGGGGSALVIDRGWRRSGRDKAGI
jgi:hypothetical protein